MYDTMVAIAASCVLSVFSTAIMSYVALATSIGPWIAPTVVMLLLFFFHLMRQKAGQTVHIALITCAASVGGILATACAFSFPTLYFVDAPLFNDWMACPWRFCLLLTLLSGASGWLGLWLANIFDHRLLVEDNLPFPVGQLIYKMISAQQQIRKAYELVAGFITTTLFCVLQDGVYGWAGVLPKSVALIQATRYGTFCVPPVMLDVSPMLWSIGFIAGGLIAVPLLVGAVANIIIVNPCREVWFIDVSPTDFTLAFCSGVIVSGTLLSMIQTPGELWRMSKRFLLVPNQRVTVALKGVREGICLVLVTSFLLWYANFPFITHVYLFLLTAICSYQVAVIAGKIGLAYLGRFATFVMVPAMLLFQLQPVHLVIIATFVEVCAGVMVDALAGRKVAALLELPVSVVKKFQYLGLIVSSLSVGCVFWLLIHHFGLGTPELFAQKAYSRALLIGVQGFNLYVLMVGALFGLLLKMLAINPMFVLGGLLMPLNVSLGLIVGGLASYLVKDKESWSPLWSGVFAAHSIWMLFCCLTKAGK